MGGTAFCGKCGSPLSKALTTPQPAERSPSVLRSPATAGTSRNSLRDLVVILAILAAAYFVVRNQGLEALLLTPAN